MQSSACSDTGQPSASASRKISGHSDGRRGGGRGIGEADAVGGDLEVPADAGRRCGVDRQPGAALRAGQLARDAARVAEIDAHQRFDALPDVVPGAAERIGDPLLQLVGQDVGVAAAFGVKDAAHPQQEVLGVLSTGPADRARSLSCRSPPSVCR